MHGEDTPALAMGDFNDEPFDASWWSMRSAPACSGGFVRADTPRFRNLIWPGASLPEGTFYFNNEPNVLDQFLVNANMARRDSPIRAEPSTVDFLRFPDIISDGVRNATEPPHIPPRPTGFGDQPFYRSQIQVSNRPPRL